MATRLKIVGVGGSTATVSRSRAALHTALEGAETAGAETQLLDIRQLNHLPMYNADDDEPNAWGFRPSTRWSSPPERFELGRCPYVVPVATAARVFDRQGRIQDQAVERQLKMLGSEVVRVAERFRATCHFTVRPTASTPLNALRQLRS